MYEALHLSSGGKLCDRDANHTIDILDACLGKCMSHHCEAIATYRSLHLAACSL